MSAKLHKLQLPRTHYSFHLTVFLTSAGMEFHAETLGNGQLGGILPSFDPIENDLDMM